MKQGSFWRAMASGRWRWVLVAVLFAASGTWRIMTASDPSQAAVGLVIAAGVAVLAGVLLFARELRRIVVGPLYLALALGLLVWLVLSFGVAQWQWGLLPP